MTSRDEQAGNKEREEGEKLRKAEFAEAEEMRARGTLTPEAAKEGVTSHLPAGETAEMYRSKDEGKKG
jgi:hypothetical protein